LTIGYEDKKEFFIQRLAQGVAKIAAAFYPKDVIVRMSDFKSNEYANLIGGSEFEPVEDNPMIGSGEPPVTMMSPIRRGLDWNASP
jgi:pyruvate,water dikinase